MGMLAVVVGGLDKLDTILPAASALAKRHVAYGAAPEHYPVVGGALLWTLEKGLGESLDARGRGRVDRRLHHAVRLHDLGSLSADQSGAISLRMSESLVIVGNGMAAARLVEQLSARALGRYAIAVIGEEPQLAYNRVLLSSVLADDVTIADTELKPARWWRDRGVTLLYGQAATSVDRSLRRVKLASGATLPYSKLVFATGSRPILLPIEGRELKGVMTFRDMRDVATLKNAGKCNAVVIGGGLLGLEAAYGLAKAGAKVTVVHLMDRLMERQLDAEAAAMLKAAVESRGIEVLLNAETARFAGDKKVERVELKDGRSFPADIVVMAAGIAPNVALARSAGAAINRGIVVDAQMQTDIPGLYAIGECAEHEGRCVGLVEPAYEQAAVLADTLDRRQRALCRQHSRHQSEGDRRQRVLGRRLHGRARHRADPVPRPRSRHLQEAGHRRRSSGRRGAVRRYRGRALVSRPDPHRRADRALPQRARLRARARRTQGGLSMAA